MTIKSRLTDISIIYLVLKNFKSLRSDKATDTSIKQDINLTALVFEAQEKGTFSNRELSLLFIDLQLEIRL